VSIGGFSNDFWEQRKRESDERQLGWEQAMDSAGTLERTSARFAPLRHEQKLAHQQRQQQQQPKPKTYEEVVDRLSPDQQRKLYDALEPRVYQGAEPVTDESYLEPEEDLDTYEELYGNES